MRTFVIAGVLVAGNFAAFSQQPYVTDHFNCYRPSQATQIQPTPIRLKDQFAENGAGVGRVFRFCNPTVKVRGGAVTPIQNPNDHLTLILTSPQPLVTRTVKIRNQFGDQVLTTLDARILAVPTQKAPHDPPKNTDHFNCYIAQGTPVGGAVALTDQFFTSTHTVGRPLFFCNPVQKTHNDVVTPITHPDDHLTCYAQTAVPLAKQVRIRHQFGDGAVQTAVSDILCVPTTKVSWAPTLD